MAHEFDSVSSSVRHDRTQDTASCDKRRGLSVRQILRGSEVRYRSWRQGIKVLGLTEEAAGKVNSRSSTAHSPDSQTMRVGKFWASASLMMTILKKYSYRHD